MVYINQSNAMEPAASSLPLIQFQFQFKSETVCVLCACAVVAQGFFFYLGAGEREREGEQVLLTSVQGCCANKWYQSRTSRS